MMRVVISSPQPHIAASVVLTAETAGIDTRVEPSLQEFGSLLYRDPEAAGILYCMGPWGAVETCIRLRQADVRNILFVLLEEHGPAHVRAADRTSVLMAGADDVQPWPVDPLELVARLRVLDRRKRESGPELIQLPGCVFNPETGTVTGDNQVVFLTKQQSKLLEALASRPGLCVSKAMCMLALYDGRDEAQIKIIDVFVCKLRAKLFGVTGGLDVIETVWGQGYRFKPEGFAPAMRDARKRAVSQ